MFSGTFETQTPFVEIALRLVVALILGGLIGLERELKDRPAGLRTHMMVALAAATFTVLSAELISESTEESEIIRIDTLRIIEAVIAGVAFLGAGAIIRAGRDVRGLTTGASLWMSGAIGVSAGGGYYVVAVTAAVLAIVVLYLLKLLERRLHATKSESD
ncbi:MAG: MgtC/SapB family protein [Kiloniellales bacterium]|jgi:putative Mg2+ transporter-C (MgtC) family protein|nr:MgtC/SapB family protein [Kiloniellales bacterium]